MISPIKKSLIGIVSAGALGGAGVGVFYLSSDSNNIGKKLEKEGFTLISDENDWASLLEKYKNAKTDLFEKNKENINLKNKCKTILNQNSQNKNYRLARKWCVKEQKIKEILEKGGYKILDSNFTTTTDNEIWEQKVNLLKINLDRFLAVKEKIKDVQRTNPDNIKFLKESCKELTIDTLLTTGDKFNENFDLAKEWCSIKKNDTSS